MNSRDPASTGPKGAKRPWVKWSHTESQPAVRSAAGTPSAPAAFISRAPSMWVDRPCAWAALVTACNASTLQHAPPPRLAVCSTSTNRCVGEQRETGRIASSSVSTVNMPRSPVRPLISAPAIAAGAPPSLDMMCEDSCARISSPGRQCVAIATWLHIVPDGRNTAASLPSSAALRSHSAHTVGSEPNCSSPTSASIIASFMARVGLVCVSEERLMRTGIEKSNRFGSYDMTGLQTQLIDSTDLPKFAQATHPVGDWLVREVLRPERARNLADVNVAARIGAQPMRTDIVGGPDARMLATDAREQIALVVDDRQPWPEVRVVAVGPRRRTEFADVADRAGAVRHEHAARAMQIVELRFVAAVAVEHLDTMVLAIGDIDPAIRIARDVMHQVELAGLRAGLAP